MNPQYTARVDAVVYQTPITADFTAQDWLDLAMAALDQAGANVRDQERVREMFSFVEEDAAQ